MLTRAENNELNKLKKEIIAFRNFKLKNNGNTLSCDFFMSYQEIVNKKIKLEFKQSIMINECSHVDTEDLKNDKQ